MWWYTDGVQLAYKILLVEMALAVLVNILLNFFWAYLILRQLYRLVCQRGKHRDEFCGDEGGQQKKGENSASGGKKDDDMVDSEDEEGISPRS